MPTRAARIRGSRPAFTLLEVTIVVVIIALMASMILPRFAGSKKREFNLVVDRVADLVMMFAQRESLSQQTVGIRYASDLHAIELVLLERTEDRGSVGTWIVDNWVAPVRLPDDVELVEVRADGDAIDIVDWPLSTTPLDRRPSLSLTLQSADDHVATIVLAPHAVGPIVYDDRRSGGFQLTPEDLDRAGRTREPW